ncbi:hypothetical protein HMPREF3293_01269 [Christensenella minuta]|uniref:Uncharacterized protein n=1 Tax=Christensenella minuta TaxID=626937 RepID=A0A136Q5N9_9FIRM|nr:hypothetical protein HMPREF3293_01269 [Christensenella minuta]
MTDLHNNGISVTAWGPFSMGIRRKTAGGVDRRGIRQDARAGNAAAAP